MVKRREGLPGEAQMTDLLASRAVRIWRGDAKVFVEIGAVGTDPHREGAVFSARGPSGVRTGFQLGDDPVTNAAQLGFYYFGAYWPQVVPDLLPEVNRQWKKWTMPDPVKAKTPTLKEQGLDKDGYPGLWCSRCGENLLLIEHSGAGFHTIGMPTKCPKCGYTERFQTYPPKQRGPHVKSKVNHRVGPGRGWHKEHKRHVEAGVKGARGRRRR